MSEQMMSRDRVIELLLDVADIVEKDDESPGEETEKRIMSRLHKLAGEPFFVEYSLEAEDIMVIAILFGRYFDNEDEIGIRDIIKKLGGDKKEALKNINKIIKLEKLGIVEIEMSRDKLMTGMKADTQEDISDSIEILRSTARLDDRFLHNICSIGKKVNTLTLEPYKDNMEYLADQFKRIETLRRDDDMPPFASPRLMRTRRYRRTIRSDDKYDDLEGLEKMIKERLSKTDKVFPLEEFKKQKSLTREEDLIIVALLEHEALSRGHCEIAYLLGIISKNTYEKLSNKRFFNKDQRLIKEKWIEIESRSGLFTEEESIKLNSRLKCKLLGEKNKRLKIKEDDFFEAIKPSISIDKVILHSKTYEDIRLAIEMIQGGVAERLREWGIKGSNLLQSSKMKGKYQPVTALFFGAPGTGKTLTANAVAHSLKRDLITFDCSKILSMWVGEAEKSTRMIFDRYRELSAGMSKPPVLLLNEADQFLHRRTSARGAADHSYNQMQNIFLEQIEQFDGILIATTNLVENMDAAFSRRFHYKIEFKRPGHLERLGLWQVHIPEKTPLSDDVDLNHLAERYDLSGGQIAIVVRNAATRAAQRGDKLYQEDLIKACEDEMAGNFDEEVGERVGF